MFTGIVEEVGTVNKIRWGQHSAILEISAKTVLTAGVRLHNAHARTKDNM